MRITLFISSLSSGGAERVLILLAQGFVERGHTVSVVTMYGREVDFYPLPDQVHRYTLNLGGNSTTLFQKVSINFKRLGALRKTILKTGPDVVISFMDRSNIITLVSLLGTKIPVVVTEHCDPTMLSPGRIWEWLRHKLYPYADRVVSVSSGVDSYFSWIAAEKRVVIYNPAFIKQSDLNCSESPVFPGKHKLVAMGRLEYQKGFDLLIKAFAKIASEFPDWRLIILGEGSERPKIANIIQQFGLTGIVQIPGRLVNPFPVLKSADLFVLSSRTEGFGNVIIEAMACGLPVVSFDCPSGPREIIRQGIDGILVPAEDVDSLAAALARLMSDGLERKRLASRAVEVTHRFGLAKVVGIWEELLETVVFDNVSGNCEKPPGH